MSNPLEGTYGLYLWEVGGSSFEPTDTGRRGSLEEMNMVGYSVTSMHPDGEFEIPETTPEKSGRVIRKHEVAGYVVRPIQEDA